MYVHAVLLAGYDPFSERDHSPEWLSRRRNSNREETHLRLTEEERHLQDYSSHPLVLGKGFQEEDFRVFFANRLSYRQSGLLVATINKYKFVSYCIYCILSLCLCYKKTLPDRLLYYTPVSLSMSLRNSSLPRTYRVVCEFGRASDTGWTEGKTLERSTYAARLKGPILAKALAAIAGSHQREAFALSKVRS